MAKIKCSKTSPCERCVRRGIECVPHDSRQGQRKKKRSASDRKLQGTHGDGAADGDGADDSDGADDDCDELDVDGHPKNNIVENTLMSSISERLGPTHFGLHLILRQWIAFAFTRRSFTLLAKASTLAKKSGIPMDRIMCGTDWPAEWTVLEKPFPQMQFLRDILCVTLEHQVVEQGRMPFADIPEPLLVATYSSRMRSRSALAMEQNQITSDLTYDEGNADDFDHDGDYNVDDDDDDQHLGDRLITIKEMNCGVVRFFTSSAFERDVCSWKLMQERWRANSGNVMELFLPRSELVLYANCLAHQISLHSHPNTPPFPTRLPTTKIILRTGQVVEAECVQCFHIVNIDLSMMYLEYIPVERTSGSLSQSPSAFVRYESQGPFTLERIAMIDFTSELEEWVQEMNA